MIQFHSLHVAPKQNYLHSILFHLFPFLYFKTSNQGSLISFHSFPFIFLKYISFHSIPFHSLIFISFHSISLWTPKQSLSGAFLYLINNYKKKNSFSLLSVLYAKLSLAWLSNPGSLKGFKFRIPLLLETLRRLSFLFPSEKCYLYQ